MRDGRRHPHARGYPPCGNVPTEDLANLFHELGVETGVDLDAVVGAARTARDLLGLASSPSHALAGATRSDARAGSERVTGRLPLEGVRVLDLSNLLAAPMATMYLADFGAEVIKAEHPARGDELRRWGNAKDGVGLYFKVLGRNKKLITLNLSHPDGQALVRRLVEHVDVVVENYRPGTLERWGIGWDDLRAINPGLVMARVTGFGQTGPYRGRAGFGTNAEAFAGAAAISGFPDRPPLLPAFGLGDSTTGIHAAFGIMVALYHRDVHGGEGQ